MVINTNPRRPSRRRRGPSCSLVIAVILTFIAGAFIITNADTVRETITPPPTPAPTRSASSYAASAALLQEDGEYADAIDLYEQAIRLDGTRVEFYLPLIELLTTTGEPEDALTWAEQVVVLAPENDRAWAGLAAANLAVGNRQIDLGQPTEADLSFAEAVRAGRSAIDLNSSNAMAHAYVAGAMAQLGPEQYARAQEEAEIALELEPDNPLVHYYMASVFELQGYYQSAIEQYNLALDEDPNMVILHIGLAYNYFALGDRQTAILTFEDALAIDPNSAEAYDGIGYMYFLIGEYPTAQENLVKAVELDGEMVRGHAHLGAAYYRNLNYADAIPELEYAINSYKEVTLANSTYFKMLGYAYYIAGAENCDKASPLFRDVLDAFP
ncbi:MAG: tetratricopeptide repeat protein, partial [Candidatus Promineifilaceae bacterium]